MNNLILNQPTQITTLNSPSREDVVNGFISSQDVSISSRATYRKTLKQYFLWIDKKNYSLPTIARPQILQYKEELLSSGMSSLTVGGYINSVRRFYEWAEAEKLYPNVAKGVKSPARKQQFKKQALSIDQTVKLLDHLKSQALRDYAIINLMVRTGLREIEIVRANIEDISYKGGKRVLNIQGKGRRDKDNFVILTEKSYKPIAEYLETRGRAKTTEPLFISESSYNKGERLTTRTISYIAKEGLKAIGINERSFTAHSLRHTTAVNILRAGGRIEDAQGVLRHSSPATTQIYTATIKEEMRIKNAPEELIDSLY